MANDCEHDCGCTSCQELKELLLIYWRIKAVIVFFKYVSTLAVSATGIYVFLEFFNKR